MTNSIYVFIASSVEVLAICCILRTMREIYWKKKEIAIMVVAIAAITMAFDAAQIDINLGLNMICMAAILLILYRVHFLQGMFDAIGSILVFEIIQMGYLFICSSIVSPVLDSNVGIVAIEFILTILIFCCTRIPPLILFVREHYQKHQSTIWLVLLNILFVQIIYFYQWDKNGYRFGTEKGTAVASMLIVVLTNLLLAFKSIKAKRQEEEIKKQQKLDAMKEAFMERMAASQHEFSRHLQVIGGLAAEADAEAAIGRIRDYVNELIERRSETHSSGYVGDGAVSALLMQKISQAKERNIVFSTLVKKPMPEFPCTQTELIELTGNLIDNAFDAVSALEVERKKIFFEIGEQNGHTYLQTMNALPVDFNLNEEQMVRRGFSTKGEAKRGYGLPNIKAIAQKNSGKVTIQSNGDVILIKVLF